MEITNHPGFQLESVPLPPQTLSEGGTREWKALAPLIYEMRTARPADLPVLELLCEIRADIHGLEKAIKTEGYTLAAGSGGRKAHPALQSLTAARRQAQNLLGIFGLVPGSKAEIARTYSEYDLEHRYGLDLEND